MNENNLAGLERIELPPSVSKTEMISISPKPGVEENNGIEPSPVYHKWNTFPRCLATITSIFHYWWSLSGAFT
jgi:hypothetical protein